MSEAVATPRRPLAFVRRADIEVVPLRSAEQPCFVLSDPVTQDHFQLTAEEHFVWSRIGPSASLADLQTAFQRAFAPRRISVEQLSRFVERLYAQRLIVSQRPGQTEELQRRGVERRRTARRARYGSPLAIRLGGFACGPLVARIDRVLRPFTGRVAAAAAAALVLVAFSVAMARAAELRSDLAQALQWQRPADLFPWIALVLAAKVLHELGHALACARQGAECRQAGVLLLAGLPALYCDVSDAWRLPDKRARLLVAAAGMLAEIVLAAAAILLWQASPPGATRLLWARLAVVCSLGTLLVNANPLLRYDGYYLLADGWEVPNLATRARESWRGRWRQWLLGVPPVGDPWLSPLKQRALACYALTAAVYLAVVSAALFAAAWRFAVPHGGEAAVVLLAVAAVAAPLARLFAAAARLVRDPAARARLRTRRAVLAAALGGGFAAGLWQLPVTRAVRAPVRLVAADLQPLYAKTGGFLAAAAAPGDRVESGRLVLQLADPDGALAALRQTGQADALALRAAHLDALRRTDPQAAADLPAALAAARESRALARQWEAAADDLTVRAAVSGTLAPAPRKPARTRPPDPADSPELSGWAGHLFEPRNRGAWVEAGTLLGAVQTDASRAALAAVDPGDVGAIAPEQPVRVVLDGHPFRTFRGTVVRVASRAQANRPDDGLPSAGAAPRRDYHVVEIRLADAQPDLLPGLHGRARIETYRTTVGELLTRGWRRWWKFG